MNKNSIGNLVQIQKFKFIHLNEWKMKWNFPEKFINENNRKDVSEKFDSIKSFFLKKNERDGRRRERGTIRSKVAGARMNGAGGLFPRSLREKKEQQVDGTFRAVRSLALLEEKYFLKKC